MRGRPEELLIHFVNGNPGADLSRTGATDLFVDEIPTIGPISAELRCPEKPTAVFLEPGHKPLAYEWSGDRLRFTLPSLKIHSCVRIQPWQ